MPTGRLRRSQGRNRADRESSSSSARLQRIPAVASHTTEPSITELNALSNESLLLQLQQRNLSLSGSRATREARLADSLSQQPASSSAPSSSEALPGTSSSLSADIQSFLRDAVASAVSDALGSQASSSAPRLPSPTPIQPAPLPVNPSFASLPTSTVPSRISDRILNGEFTNLDDLLPEALGATPAPIQLHLPSTSGQPVQLVSDPSPTSVRRRVHDLATWLEAWTAYVSVVLSAAPQRAGELLGYQAIIIDANRKFYPDAWLAYDRQFRMACASAPTRRWDQVDANMWQLSMTGKARPVCTACSLVHPLSGGGRCPFRPFNSAGAPLSSSTSRPREVLHNGREVCRNFNFRRCALPQCARAHVCFRCRGNHAAINCASHEPAAKRSRSASRSVVQQS